MHAKRQFSSEQRMSFRTRSVTNVKIFFAFSREKRHLTNVRKFPFLEFSHISARIAERESIAVASRTGQFAHVRVVTPCKRQSNTPSRRGALML